MNTITKDAALVLRAVNNKTRVQIINLLRTKGRATVTDVYVNMSLEQSVVSQHLGILKRAGVVKAERDGKWIHYSLNNTRINEITDLCSKIVHRLL